MKTFTCKRCGQSFGRYQYPAHTRWCRKGSITCTVCKREFKNAQGLGNHMNVHKGSPKRAPRAGRKMSRLAKALARKGAKLREKGMAYLAVARKIDLMVGALGKVE